MDTATRWLFDQLWETPKDKLTWYAILKKAEEMHKEQVVDAIIHNQNGLLRRKDVLDAEQYYNDTYSKSAQ